MTPLAMLLGLVLPACGAAGTGGLPPAAPIDLAHLVRPASPNTALAAPAGFTPTPDIVTRRYAIPPDRLLAIAEAVASRQDRTFLQARFPAQSQAAYVVRSAVFNFPDLVAIAAAPAEGGGSDLILWSRSVYGRSDLGVNRRRLVDWIGAIDRDAGKGA